MRQFVIAGFLLTLLAGCQRSPAPPDRPESKPPSQAPLETPAATASGAPPIVATPRPAPVPPLPEGTDVSYQCEDGNEVTVTYRYVNARLRWPDGRALTLTRAASSPKDGGDVYADKHTALQHDGAIMRLSQDGAPPVSCSEASSTA